MKPKTVVLTLLLFFLFPTIAFSQSKGKKKKKRITQRFHAGAQIGLNWSQIDGDKFQGFHKRNIQGGLFVDALFSHFAAIRIELLYTQKGSKIGTSSSRASYSRDRIINLQYIEVPVLLLLNLNGEPKGYYLELGASYARLISRSITEEGLGARSLAYKPFLEDFKSGEINLVGGIGYKFMENISLKFRYVVAATKFFENPVFLPNDDGTPSTARNPTSDDIVFFRNYHISLMAAYHF